MENDGIRKRNVAETILQQLGGRVFLMMTGCKNLVYDAQSLRMRLTKNQSKANYLKITLCDDDTYEMLFFYDRPPRYQVRNGKVLEQSGVHREIARFDGVYCDMLCPIFTQVTGQETHLPFVCSGAE